MELEIINHWVSYETPLAQIKENKMTDNNKHNILYFEGSSMLELHNTMDE